MGIFTRNGLKSSREIENIVDAVMQVSLGIIHLVLMLNFSKN